MRGEARSSVWTTELERPLSHPEIQTEKVPGRGTPVKHTESGQSPAEMVPEPTCMDGITQESGAERGPMDRALRTRKEGKTEQPKKMGPWKVSWDYVEK